MFATLRSPREFDLSPRTAFDLSPKMLSTPPGDLTCDALRHELNMFANGVLSTMLECRLANHSEMIIKSLSHEFKEVHRTDSESPAIFKYRHGPASPEVSMSPSMQTMHVFRSHQHSQGGASPIRICTGQTELGMEREYSRVSHTRVSPESIHSSSKLKPFRTYYHRLVTEAFDEDSSPSLLRSWTDPMLGRWAGDIDHEHSRDVVRDILDCPHEARIPEISKPAIVRASSKAFAAPLVTLEDDEDEEDARKSLMSSPSLPPVLTPSLPPTPAAKHNTINHTVTFNDEFIRDPCQWDMNCFSQFVRSHYFEQLSGFLILANSIYLGIEADRFVDLGDDGPELPRGWIIADYWFTTIFTSELILRMIGYGSRFFSKSEWHWHLFDCFVVSIQLAGTLSHVFMRQDFTKSVSVMRMMRLLRLIRVTRLVRVLHNFHALSTLVSSIMGSMRSLLWTLLLLVLVVYSFSILFTEVVWDAIDQGADDREALEYWFGGIMRTALTLFESVVGGVSWDEVVNLLIVHVSPVAGLAFVIYIAFCVFALLNVVTGVFVEKATSIAKEGTEESAAKQINDLFMKEHEGANRESYQAVITWERFNQMLDTEEMQRYFKVINVDPSEGLGLFRLLDVDGSGTLDPKELVDGLLRLRGTAKAVDLSLLMRQVQNIHDDLRAHEYKVESNFKELGKGITFDT